MATRNRILPSVAVKNEWTYPSTPTRCFQGVYRDNFNFTSAGFQSFALY